MLLIKWLKVPKYISLTDDRTPKEKLLSDVWIFHNEKPNTPYFEIKVKIVKHEKLYNHERNGGKSETKTI